MKFDSNGIYASSPELTKIALQVMEQEKRERELRRSMSDEDLRGQWGTGTSAIATDRPSVYN